MQFRNAMRFASLVTGFNALVLASIAVVGLVNPLMMLPVGSVANEAAFTFAIYAAARSIPLAVFVLVSIFMRFGRMLFDKAREPKGAHWPHGAGHNDLLDFGMAEAVTGFLERLGLAR